MKINRRVFLKQSAIGTGAVLLGSRLGRAATTAAGTEGIPIYFDPYAMVPLGKTGMKWTRMCIGTGMRGGNRESNQTRMGKEKFSQLLKGAFDRGVRVFDLADLYGTHPYVIPAIKEVPRKDYAIISKIWFKPGGIPDKERPDADVVINRFLKELGTDYIDLVLLHCVTSPKWNQELEKQMGIMADLKKKGVIRAHGVSCHSLEALETAAAEPWVDSVHARINPYGMSMDGPAERVAPVLQKINAAGKAVVGMKLVGEGRLRNDEEKRSESVKYVLGLGCVDILNVGFEKLEEIDDFTGRVRKVKRQA
jgi:aryl-alcohol dehydrogenase-like predicted oxidoreductase